MTEKQLGKIQEAVKLIEQEVCARVDVDDNIKVYRCKNVIRIDIKEDK